MEQPKEFDDYKDATFDDLQGGSDQVLGDAYLLDTGKAITEKDLFTEGSYPLHLEPGAEVWAVRDKQGAVQVRVLVEPWREETYREELEVHRRTFNTLTDEQKKTQPTPIYHLKAYHVAIMSALHDVHPYWDEEEFEKVLWREMPDAWIDVSKAPRHTPKLII